MSSAAHGQRQAAWEIANQQHDRTAQPRPSARKSCCSTKRYLIAAFSSLALCIILMSLGYFLPNTIDNMLSTGLEEATTMREEWKDRDSFKNWADTSRDKDAIPIYNEIFLWNVTNPAQIIAGAKPVLEEIGPYVYRTYDKKLDVEFITDEIGRKVVKARTYTWNVFQRHLTPSHLREDDVITTVRMAFFATQTMFGQSLSPVPGATMMELLWGSMSDEQKLFTQKTVYELLWGHFDGHPMIADPIPGLMGRNHSSEADANTRFNWAYTGEDYPELAKTLFKVNDMTHTMCNGKPAYTDLLDSAVFGSSGVQFRRDAPEHSIFYVYVDQASRTIPLFHNETVKFKGVELRRYVIDPAIASTNHSTAERYHSTTYNGIFNVSKCMGVPMVLSFPHMLHTDPLMQEQIEGQNPVASKHQVHLDVEPITGMTMVAHKRMQANMFVEPFQTGGAYGTFLPNVRDHLFVPIFYVDYAAEATDKAAAFFKDNVLMAFNLKKGIYIAGYTVGIILLVATTVLFMLAVRSAKHASSGISTKYVQPL